jgi:hypothetical protein
MKPELETELTDCKIQRIPDEKWLNIEFDDNEGNS